MATWTIEEMKSAYAKEKRNAEAPPNIQVDGNRLTVTETLVGGTECVHLYQKYGRRWAYVKTIC